jgi:hypothetical protein
MFSFFRCAAALLLVSVAVVAGCEKQSAPTSPPQNPSSGSSSDTGAGNAPNTGNGEPSAASP